MVLNNYFKLFVAVLLTIICNVAAIAMVSFGNQKNTSSTLVKLKDSRTNRPVYNKNTSFEANAVNFFMLKNGNDKSFLLNLTDDPKPIDNVKIFPNPVSTQINISFYLKKDNKVSIKILDVLGNEVITLLEQKLSQGEQSNSFTISSKIPAGFYFVRIVSGNDAVIKRISVI
jgi:hypothetical protein